MAFGCTNGSASDIQQKRWLRIACSKAADLEINLENAIYRVRLLEQRVVHSSAVHQDALRTVGVCGEFWTGDCPV